MSTCDFTLQTDLSSVNYCATGVSYISLSLFRSIFLFATPITDCSLNTSVFNNPDADISYNVLSALYPEINPVHAMMGSSLSEGIIRTDSSSNILIKHDFIFYLAEEIFNNSTATFFLSNKKELKREIEEIGWLYKNDIEQNLTIAFNSGLGMTNTITDKSNLTRRLLKQIEYFEPDRLVCKPNDISSGIIDTDEFQSVPFIEGDSVSIFFPLTCAAKTRIYRHLLYLTNDFAKLSSNINPKDGVINDIDYQGNITNDGVPGPLTVVISYNGSNTIGSLIFITFTFSKIPVDFVISDITVLDSETPLNGKITNLSTSGLVRTAIFTPPQLDTYTLRIGAGKFTNESLEPNVMSNELQLLINSSGINPGTYQIDSGTYNQIRAPFDGLYDYSQYGNLYLTVDLHTTTGTTETISSLYFEDTQPANISNTTATPFSTSWWFR